LLIRKVRRVGSSLIVSLPSQVCEVYDIKAGDKVEITLSHNDKKIMMEKLND